MPGPPGSRRGGRAATTRRRHGQALSTLVRSAVEHDGSAQRRPRRTGRRRGRRHATTPCSGGRTVVVCLPQRSGPRAWPLAAVPSGPPHRPHRGVLRTVLGSYPDTSTFGAKPLTRGAACILIRAPRDAWAAPSSAFRGAVDRWSPAVKARPTARRSGRRPRALREASAGTSPTTPPLRGVSDLPTYPRGVVAARVGSRASLRRG